jgi:NAD(P)-dependent dehydrogenase (short-subunit alcohol dehydrogenase family)
MAESRVVVVTGASAGIGRALAEQLAARGDRVVLAARREQELAALASALGPDTLAVPTDVTRRQDVVRLRDRAIERFGHIDVWVNNAGRGIGRRVLELTDEDVDAIIAINLKSALYGMQAIVPHFMERQAGHVINVSSFLSRVPMATIRSVYSAAKAALNSLTANLRVDLAVEHPGIHVTLVMPGIVTTEFHRNALGGTPLPPPLRPGVPAGQTAEEVAAVIVGTIDHPVAEVYTNPQHPAIARRYFEDVGAFEESQRTN